MKTTTEIRIEALRVIDSLITLKANVSNGCFSDIPEMVKQEARLEGIKNWAIANNQIQEFKQFFASNNFGQTRQFAAVEISRLF